MKLSHHSIIRMSERANLKSVQEKKKMFRDALSYGKSLNDIHDEKIRNYILSKINYCKIKLYKGYVFVYSKNSKRLYTMYKLPEEIIGGEEN